MSEEELIKRAGRDGPMEAFGLVYGEATAERVQAHLPVTDAVRQPVGIVHGGVYSAVAESIASAATALAVAADGAVAMGQSNVAAFMRPISEGTIHAEAKRRHRGRTTWVWDVDFKDEEDRLCASARVTVAVRPAPSESPGAGSA